MSILCFRLVIFVFGCSRRAEMKEDNHIFREKKIWKKIIFFHGEFWFLLFRKNIFRDQKRSRKNRWKSQWKMKISKFHFFSKKSKFWNFHFSLTFSSDFFPDFLWSRKIFFDVFPKKFSSRKNIFRKNIFYYSDPKFSQESKNHT